MSARQHITQATPPRRKFSWLKKPAQWAGTKLLKKAAQWADPKLRQIGQRFRESWLSFFGSLQAASIVSVVLALATLTAFMWLLAEDRSSSNPIVDALNLVPDQSMPLIDRFKVGGAIVAGAVGVIGVTVSFRKQRAAERTEFDTRFISAQQQLAHPNPLVRLGAVAQLSNLAKTFRRQRDVCIKQLQSLLELPAPPQLQPGVEREVQRTTWSSDKETTIERQYYVLHGDSTVRETALVTLTELVKEHTLRSPDLRELNLTNISLTGWTLAHAKAEKVNLRDANLSGASLSSANLFGAQLFCADLTGAKLLFAYLTRANLSGAKLFGAKLFGANLSGASLTGANLTDASLKYADLSKADLTYAKLSKAELSKADLSYADLSYAELSKADLNGADLSKADLSKADLNGADLNGADLTDADLNGADLTDAKHSDATSWPRNFTPPASR